ncbi:helix-turn-helix domain-containing protein [Streptomyces sp. NPDC006997]|uniref:helix-turn-helix domain-containing protein n=1 Tax=Streptomyces sp. NPDC006997 TaxID=3155356 RepID=UPI003400BB99
MPHTYSDEFVAWVRGLQFSRRAQRALEHILEHGSVTTAELNGMGYDHPPRAIGDLRDAGVTVVKEMVTVDGRRMARYALLDQINANASGIGRKTLSKRFREDLYDMHGHKCAICGGSYTSRELQADHRVPFRIAGDSRELLLDEFMPLCASCNRAKSWTCENCPNWEPRDKHMCTACLWASPDTYGHIAGTEERRIAVTLQGDQVHLHDRLSAAAAAAGVPVDEWVRENLELLLENNETK